MISEKKRILYVGAFQLPDKNAAASRVMGIAKALRDCGFAVEFLDVSDEMTSNQLSNPWDAFGFRVYSQRHAKGILNKIPYILSPLHIRDVLQTQTDWHSVIAYNYPAIALLRLKRMCRKEHIKVYSDCTEWYGLGSFSLWGIVNYLDSELRMRFVNKRLDGVIAISSFLEDYYKAHTKVILVPPTVDIQDSKWDNPIQAKQDDKIQLTYAGSLGRNKNKDRLDLLIEALETAKNRFQLNIVGLTVKECCTIFPKIRKSVESLQADGTIRFYGHVSHLQALEYLKGSDYSVIIRKNNRANRAGFPTKFVESISCTVPVICTPSSDLGKYISEQCILVSIDELGKTLQNINRKKGSCCIDRTWFDYRNYEEVFSNFLKSE